MEAPRGTERQHRLWHGFRGGQCSGTITTLASFNRSNSYNPLGGVIMDSSGNLYGTANETVFEVASGSGTITDLAFLGAGSSSFGGVIMDSSGNLYLTTYGGGGAPDHGTVLEVPHRGSTTLATFNGTNGSEPEDA